MSTSMKRSNQEATAGAGPPAKKVAISSSKEALKLRLQNERECLENARELLLLAQQNYDQAAKMVQRTQSELRGFQDEGNSLRALVESSADQGIRHYIMSFLDISDLGSMACVCQEWNSISQDEGVWKELTSKRAPVPPPPIVSDYRSYLRSLTLRRTPEQRLVYPHYQNNEDCEEYYLMVEFPFLHESSPDGTIKPIARCIKLDDSLMVDESQNAFELPICVEEGTSCPERIYQNAWVRLPMNVETVPFEMAELYQCIQFKISMLRASDCKVALLMDPRRRSFYTLNEEDEHPEDVLHFNAKHNLREIPNFCTPDSLGESPLVFRVAGAVEPYADYERNTLEGGLESNCFKLHENGDYSVHLKHVLFGFETGQIETDSQHMAPPFQSKCLTEFLSMARVEWH